MSDNDRNIENVFPLSPLQQGILFETLLAPESGLYFGQFSYTLTGDLQTPALQEAWRRVVDRHCVLRSLFVWQDKSKPLQVVRQHVALPWRCEDWRALSAAQQRAKFESFLVADRQAGFDLARAPLMRMTLIRMANDRYELVWSIHHLLLDGWSGSLVLGEVVELYHAACEGRECPLEPSLPYREYVRWLRRQDIAKAEAYWRKDLDGFASPTPFAIDRNGSEPFSEIRSVAEHEQELSVEATSRLTAFCRQNSLTLNTLMQGAWALLLSRYSGENDVMFGSVVSGRPTDLPKSESMIGMFINTLPVRARMSPEEPVRSWLNQFQRQLVEMRQFEYSPLTEVHGWSQVPRDVPLFDSLIVFRNYPDEFSAVSQRNGLRFAKTRSVERTNYPLSIAVLPQERLKIRAHYDLRRFDDAAIRRMLRHLAKLLEGIVGDADRPLSDLPLLTDDERQQILVDWNRTEQSYPLDRCTHRLFEQQVERTPEAIAVAFEGRRLTYRQLNERANQSAHRLRKLGVGPDSLVGVCVERSLEMVIGLLGIIKAGGAYVPLDTSYPKERLSFMMADTALSVVLTQQSVLPLLPENNATRLCLDANWKSISTETTDNPPGGAGPGNLAYVIYTSGSTGKPKGVLVEHGPLAQHCLECQHFYELKASDRVLQFASPSFDVAIEQILPPLMSGATVVMRDRANWSPQEFQYKLGELGLTVINLPPAYWHELSQAWAESGDPIASPALRLVLIGGEAMSPATLQLWRRTPLKNVKLCNAYGPTETVITATSYVIPPADAAGKPLERIPIGRLRGAREAYVLDRSGQPVPVGVSGELHLGGSGMARGYHNRPELTAEKFIANPFSSDPASRLYRTGDLVRYLPDGNIEFLGRLDDQVKVRGFRIELGEIEALLAQHPAVKACAVVTREDSPGEKRLAAYVVSCNGEIAISELREFLQSKLPDYMLPSAFVTLDRLPVTSNGKLDRRALPGLAARQTKFTDGYVAPRTPVEASLARIWAETLGLERVGIHDNFFHIGGHSLLAARMSATVKKILKQSVPLATVFRAPTIAAFADHIKLPQNNLGDLFEPVRPTGDKAVVLCFGGHLIEHLSDLVPPTHPLYWCKPEHFDGKRTRYTTVEGVASHYCDQITAAGIEGPYVLCGFSYGGLVAFETARQLYERDRASVLLFLMEPTLAVPDKEPHGKRVVHHLRRLPSVPRGERAAYIFAKARATVQLVQRKIRQIYCRARLAFGFPVPIKMRWPYVEDQYRRAAQQYVPKGFPGKLVLIHGKHCSSESMARWARLCPDDVSIHEVQSTDHVNLVSDKRWVANWANLLRHYLSQLSKPDHSSNMVSLGDRQVFAELVPMPATESVP